MFRILDCGFLCDHESAVLCDNNEKLFEGIPYSLEEAAMVDGCSRMRSLRKVILPVMFPGIVAVFVFAFIGAWNELIAGIIFTSEPSAWTIPVGLKSLIGKTM